jgi:hypothetical protein
MIGTGYDIFTDKETKPILSATLVPTEYPGVNDDTLLQKWMVPAGLTVTLPKTTMDSPQPQIVESSAQQMTLLRTGHSMAPYPGAFTLSDLGEKTLAMEKRYSVFVSQVRAYNAFDVFLRKTADLSASVSEKAIKRDIALSQNKVPEMDAILFDEMSRAQTERTHYMWEGMPFEHRPLTTLNPNFVTDVFNLPSCCFGVNHISGDNDFEQNTRGALFTPLPISALTADIDKLDEYNGESFVCDGNPINDAELDMVQPCNFLDMRIIHDFVKKYGSHYVNGVEMGGAVSEFYELSGKFLREGGGAGSVVPSEQVDSIIDAYKLVEKGIKPSPRNLNGKLSARYMARYPKSDLNVLESRVSSDASDNGIIYASVDTSGGNLVPGARFYKSRPVEDDKRQRRKWIESVDENPTATKQHLGPITDLIVHPDVIRQYADGFNPGRFSDDNTPDMMADYPLDSVPKHQRGEDDLRARRAARSNSSSTSGSSSSSHGHPHSPGTAGNDAGTRRRQKKDQSNTEEAHGHPQGESDKKSLLEMGTAEGGHGNYNRKKRKGRKGEKKCTRGVDCGIKTKSRKERELERIHKRFIGEQAGDHSEEFYERDFAQVVKWKMGMFGHLSTKDHGELDPVSGSGIIRDTWLGSLQNGDKVWFNYQARANNPSPSHPDTFPVEPTIKRLLISNYLKWSGYKLSKLVPQYDRLEALKEDIRKAENAMTKYQGMFIAMATSGIGETVYKTARASSARVARSTDHFLYNLVDECMADPTDERQKSVIAWSLLYNTQTVNYREACKETCALDHSIAKRQFITGRGDVKIPWDFRNETTEEDRFALYAPDSAAFTTFLQNEQKCTEDCDMKLIASGPTTMFQVRISALLVRACICTLFLFLFACMLSLCVCVAVCPSPFFQSSPYTNISRIYTPSTLMRC